MIMGDSERIRDALAFIPANDRDTWVKMGMAIKSELGEDGFDTWDEWSQQDETYSASDARAVWKSIGTSGSVTVGTLFYEAKANGWHKGGTRSFGTANEQPGTRLQKVPKRMATDEAKIVHERTTAAQKATAIWEAAKAAPDDHAYLLSKGIKAHSIRVDKGALVIPVSDGRELYSLQFINGDGRKRFLADGRVSGCCYLIGDPHDATTLCIAEGFATGASIHEATGYLVAVAFNAGNLLTVARALRSRFTAASIIICADDDVQANGNPGITKATEAAHAIGALLAVPNFGNDRPDGATDLNDMARQCGNEAVKRVVANAKAPAMSERRPVTESAHGEYPAPTVDLILV